jgi:hypothetical protein
MPRRQEESVLKEILRQKEAEREAQAQAAANHDLATTFGRPPKVIWLRACDYPTAVAEPLIRRQAIRVAEFLQDRDQAMLILTP